MEVLRYIKYALITKDMSGLMISKHKTISIWEKEFAYFHPRLQDTLCNIFQGEE